MASNHRNSLRGHVKLRPQGGWNLSLGVTNLIMATKYLDSAKEFGNSSKEKLCSLPQLASVRNISYQMLKGLLKSSKIRSRDCLFLFHETKFTSLQSFLMMHSIGFLRMSCYLLIPVGYMLMANWQTLILIEHWQFNN